MQRKDFLKIMATLPFATNTMNNLSALEKLSDNAPNTDRMPVLFVGHGSPMNALEDNEFTKSWRNSVKGLPTPTAILCISAHWETNGTFVTAMEKPETIHDFGGFPKALFDVQYPAPGSKWLAEETQKTLGVEVGLDQHWGLDHGAWSVLKHLYPNADVPVIQLSLDHGKDALYHYNLGKQLSKLRRKGVLIVGSGNMVHNFGYMQIKNNNFNAPFGHDWAIEANESFKKLIEKNDFQPLINYQKHSRAFQLAAPTPEHYLPMLYSIALREKDENVTFFNDSILAGSFSMTSVKIG
jgi:4,5-DOPA dioxygenase extradiol